MTAKPHGRDCPDRCSICKGAAARKVATHDGSVTVDGQAVRPIDPGMPATSYGTVQTRRKRRQRT